MNPTTLDDDIYWSHDDFVRAYNKKEIQVSVNHPAVCSLCDSILEYTSDRGITYRSSKLWFWLTPALSLISLFIWGKIGIIIIIIAVAISVFAIGSNIRQHAYDCIIDASLREPMVFMQLWGNEHLNIKKIT